jgi:hypothetical protein
VWATGVREVDKWHAISEFHGVKSRNICIRIHDIAKSEAPKKWSGVERSKLTSISEFRQIGIQESKEASCIDIAIDEIAIGKIPKGKRKV